MYAAFIRACAKPAGAAFFLAVVFGVAFAAPSLFAAPAAPVAATTVDIAKFLYGPKEITVAPGTRIVWTNHDEIPHTVTAADKAFDSKALDTNDRFEHTFAAEGDYAYLCTVHPFMTGIVHVRKQ
ncbi:cupredoxin family copper-binding protein [Rudaea sp.]|uniref:cupredoxin domain-containing protein n=1 Tax=Rudaea sp. TaxID=2136325 RepID=UPI0032209E4D